MTEAEIKELQDNLEKSKAQAEALKKEIAELRTPKLPFESADKAKEEVKKETLEEQAKKNAEEQARIAAENKKIEDTIKFNLGIEKFIDENLSIVGQEVKSIIELSKKIKYANSAEQANELRSNILSSFFKTQGHIDALITDNFKARAEEFLGLAAVVKNEKSSQYWELFELAVENLRAKEKQEELLKKESGRNTDAGIDAHNKKFFEARTHFIPIRI